MNYKTRLTGLFMSLTLPLIVLSMVPVAASAQVIAGKPACVTLDRNLSYGLGYSADVAALQDFFYSRGYFSAAITGPFGPLTLGAVKQFQRDSGVPATGFVGPLTRAALAKFCTGQSASVSIRSITPVSGAVGTTVTVVGTGFTADNTVHFGSTGVIPHVSSSQNVYHCPMMLAGTSSSCGDTQTLTFTVPNALDPQCMFSTPRCYVASMATTPGEYAVSIENSNGTSNSQIFTVTSGDTETNAPVIYKITPTVGPVGTTVTIDGRGFSANNVIHFGAGAIASVGVGSSIAIACTTDPSCVPGIHQSITFTVPSSVGPHCAAGMMCPQYLQLVTPGVYQVTVQSDGGTSNSATFTVTSGTSTSIAPSISSLSPSSTASGQIVTVTGSGFSSGASLNIYQNGQPFGSLGNLTVVNDSTATFTVPEWVGAYCHYNAICIMIAKNWPAGSYMVSVENKNGESNQVPLTIGAASTNPGVISITGLDAPSTLAMGVSGTWTVHASAPSNVGQLHYSVDWGQSTPGQASIMAPQTTTNQTSASFTHAYSGAGTYTPVFTVTDDAGHSASVSATVTVTPWY